EPAKCPGGVLSRELLFYNRVKPQNFTTIRGQIYGSWAKLPLICDIRRFGRPWCETKGPTTWASFLSSPLELQGATVSLKFVLQRTKVGCRPSEVQGGLTRSWCHIAGKNLVPGRVPSSGP